MKLDSLTAQTFQALGHPPKVAAWLERLARETYGPKPVPAPYEEQAQPQRPTVKAADPWADERPVAKAKPTPAPKPRTPALDPEVDAAYRKRIEQLETELSALKAEYAKAKHEARRAPPVQEYTGAIVAGVFKERVEHLPGKYTCSTVRHMDARTYAICQFYAEGASYVQTGKRFGLSNVGVSALVARTLRSHRPKSAEALRAYGALGERDALIAYVL